MIIYNIYAIHHNKEYWGDPHLFRPDRWFDENGNLKQHKEYFVPFGIGQRICLGAALARVETLQMAICILKHYQFSLVSCDKTQVDGKHGLVNCPPQYFVRVRHRCKIGCNIIQSSNLGT